MLRPTRSRALFTASLFLAVLATAGCGSGGDGAGGSADGSVAPSSEGGSQSDGGVTTPREAGGDAPPTGLSDASPDASAAQGDARADGGDAGPQTRYTDLVDPFIGTGGNLDINCFPGAVLPWGMVAASPDTIPSTGTPSTASHASGYLAHDDLILGFSHTRLQGTSTPDEGSVLLMPTVGAVASVIAQAGYESTYDHATESASPGYYAVTLTVPNVRAEMTATKRGAFHRYTFQGTPAGGVGRVVLDLGHAMLSTSVIDAQLTVAGSTLEGYTVPSGRFSGPSRGGLKTYFSIAFDRAPTSVSTWNGTTVGTTTSQSGTKIGAVATFDVSATTVVQARVGISFVDVNGARNNRLSELDPFDFDTTKKAASDAWENELSSVSFQGGTAAQRTIMATALYHSFVVPNLATDLDGRYVGFDGAIHSAQFEFHTNFSMWDSYRTVHPLLTLARPSQQSALVQSLIQMARDGGYYPRWPMGHGYPNITAGSPADIVVGDSYLRGIGGFDANEALDLMLKEVDSPPPAGSQHSGREGLTDYLSKGYVPVGLVVPGVGARVVVRTLEYNIADTTISKVAAKLGRTSDATRAGGWSKSYSTLWDPSTAVFRGKNADGSWYSPFDAFNASEDLYYGANATQYSWLVPQDMAGLMALHGSAATLASRLSTFFTGAVAAIDAGTNDQYYIQGNEPDVHAIYLFLQAGRPDQTQYWADWAMSQFYGTSRSGIAGNEDAGTLSAWYVLNAIGLYPVPANDLWLIGRPAFPRVDVAAENGTLTIQADNAGPGWVYVKSLTLNGTPVDHPWIHHADLAAGGVLSFEMSQTPTTWGSDFGTP